MTTHRLNDVTPRTEWNLEKSVFAIHEGNVVTTSEFLSQACQLSARLPENRYAINLCENRYLFCLAFVATVLRDTINLLPPNRTRRVVDEIRGQYSCYCITDQRHYNFAGDVVRLTNEFDVDYVTELPEIPEQRLAAIAFSSGSTGEPKPTARTWGAFSSAARCALKSLNLRDRNLLVVATVPPQHMFGLETSIFWPLNSTMSVYHGRPFFPEDVKAAVESSPLPCLLVTTPTHLRACATIDATWRNIAMVISSTAPLLPKLAERVESRFNAPVIEIFGSTETFSYAARQTVNDGHWKLYDDLDIRTKEYTSFLRAPYLSSAMALEDKLDIHEDRTFSLIGRSQDLVKVAGKRASLSELNRRLADVEGVLDGAYIIPDQGLENQRLSAVVVTRLSKQAIIDELRKSIDEVFLPRPIYITDSLPRNQIGKLSKSDLSTFLQSLRAKHEH